ncbi:hypothetical protein BpHYR1_017161 [Brachionus plicatilis]|uniref:Uncharacterized protein n=1 Tax=Brachionus plicatilis TaxID=10195 RepID=A0A3M7RDS0_BRAPC|nr:hypothetical protein BpHYR1_017161 [Brachionus plicatilis]
MIEPSAFCRDFAHSKSGGKKKKSKFSDQIVIYYVGVINGLHDPFKILLGCSSSTFTFEINFLTYEV